MSNVVTVEIAGYSAVVDAYAWEQDLSGRHSYTQRYKLWFISMLGVNVNVNAIWARLLKGEAAIMEVPIPNSQHGRRHAFTLAAEPVKSWKRFTKHLPLAAGHNLAMLPEAARLVSNRTDFLIFPHTEEDAPSLHYRFLDARVQVPLHASWQDWLWDRAVRLGEVVKLDCHGCIAYRCVPNVGTLKADLAGGIRTGTVKVEGLAA